MSDTISISQKAHIDESDSFLMNHNAYKINSQKEVYDLLSGNISKQVTRAYSTSFSLGILSLDKSIRLPIYQIYGFVRLADEIVDSFHDFNKKQLLDEFEVDLYNALKRRISTNPILNSFQEVVHKYNIDYSLIDAFMYSMRMDLEATTHDSLSYDKYIYGSAEVVGLMCLYVFVNGNNKEYNKLAEYAKILGSAFQKINFLRDINADAIDLGRVYFPGVDLSDFSDIVKNKLLDEIKHEFDQAYIGIKALPKSARLGVYVAYIYYLELYKIIKKTSAKTLLEKRASVPNIKKLSLLIFAFIKSKFIGI